MYQGDTLPKMTLHIFTVEIFVFFLMNATIFADDFEASNECLCEFNDSNCSRVITNNTIFFRKKLENSHPVPPSYKEGILHCWNLDINIDWMEVLKCSQGQDFKFHNSHFVANVDYYFDKDYVYIDPKFAIFVCIVYNDTDNQLFFKNILQIPKYKSKNADDVLLKNLTYFYHVQTLVIENLYAIEDIDLHNFSKIVDIKITNSKMRNISAKFLNSVKNKLRVVNIAQNYIQNLSSEIFTLQTKMVELNLRHNDIGRIGYENEFQNFLAELDLPCAYIDLSHNLISQIFANFFNPLTKLKNLNLAHNKIKSLDGIFIKEISSLTVINLSHNKLDRVFETDFIFLQYLELIDLSSNSISVIDQFAFKNNNKVGVINLENNLLDFRETAAPYFAESLSYLILGKNFLQKFPQLQIPNLISLDLKENYISYVCSDDLDFMFKKPPASGFLHSTTIKLAGNNIITFDLQGYCNTNVYSRSRINRLLRVLLTDNPLKCDCYSKCLKQISATKFGVYVSFRVENLYCDQPKNLAGRLFNEIDPAFLQCSNDSQICPFNCTCNFLSMSEIIVNCENSNFTSIPFNVPPSTTSLIISSNPLNSLQNLNKVPFLHKLKLENCAKLQIILNNEVTSFNKLRNLTALYLNSNNLTSFPLLTFKELNNLAELKLSFNSFKMLSRNLTMYLPNLKIISIDNNNIYKVEDNSFENNSLLERIEINNNELQLLELNLTHLQKLLFFDASNNRINLISITWPNNVEEIILSNNILRYLNLENFPSNMKYFDVSNNNLIIINIDVLHHFTQRIVINFNYNNIKHIYKQTNQPKVLLNTTVNEKVVLINYNPIVCDCSNRNFFNLLAINNKYKISHVYFEVDNLYCNAPEFIKNKPVLELKISELPCQHKDNCVENCKCYKQLSSEYRVLVCDCLPLHNFETEINELYLKNCTNSNMSQLVKLNWNSLNVISLKNLINASLPARIFSDMENLTTVTIVESNNLKFNNLVFSNLTNLLKLDLNSNEIENFENDSFSGCFKLQYLNLSYNLINALNDHIFSHLNQLQILDISSNKLTQLSDKLLQNLEVLKIFNARNNFLKFLDTTFLSHSKSLEKIDLSYNYLSNDILHFLDIPLQVTYLNLTKNNITNIEEQWLSLPNIKVLDLSFNIIQTVQLSQLLYFFDRAQINLHKNRIHTINWSENFTQEFLQQNFRNILLTLRGNPFTCDCKLFKFIRALQIFKKYVKTFSLFQYLYCNQPTDLKNQLLVEVDDENLLCVLENCPRHCICKHKAKENRNIVMCKSPTELQTCPKNVHILLLNNLQNTTYLQHNCWEFVEELKISQSFYSINISNDLLKKHKKLLKLYLSNNNLTFIPPKFFQFNLLIKQIDISNNNLEYLPSDLFSHLINLKKLKLSNNLFANINWQIPTNIEYLNLAKNNINSIIIANLNTHYELKVLNLSNNWMQMVPNKPTFLSKMKNLQILDLSYNYISIVCDTKTSIFPQSLLSLNLSHNLINCTDFWVYRNKPTSKFKNLDLSNNPVTMLKLSDFIFTNNSEILINLKNCTLSNYSLDLEKKVSNEKINALVKIDVFENEEIECDCNLTMFENIQKIQKFNYSIDLLIDTSKDCNANRYLTTSQWILNFNLSSKGTICRVKYNCPLFCVCLQTDSNVWMFCIDKQLFSLPSICPLNVKYLILDFNNISHLEGLNHSCWYNLSIISLRNNNISSLSNEKLCNLTSLKKMYLDGNQLTKPSGWLEYFVENRLLPFHITLSNNLWLCDCNNLVFQSWVTNFSKIQMIDDAWDITCANGDLMLNFDMCPVTKTNVWKILIPIVLTFSCALSVTLLTVFYYRNKTTVHAWMLSKNIFRCCVNEDEIDTDKEFDAFLCYCEEDSEYVMENLLPGLEDTKPFYKVCIHQRDWLVGEQIFDQIQNSVKNSRRTIIILSKNFTQSFWANVEFKCANYQSTQDKINRVILVVLDEDFSTETLDTEFQAYIGMITYLKIHDPQFWNKLRYAMPHKKCRKPQQSLSMLQLLKTEDQ